MTDSSKGSGYYTAAEVASIKGIRRQSVIDGCKRGQYPGAYKTEPDALNRQGIWLIPRQAVDAAATAVHDVVTVTRPLTPADLQAVIRQSVNDAIDERMRKYEERLEEHDRLLMQTMRAMQQRATENKVSSRPWWKIW